MQLSSPNTPMSSYYKAVFMVRCVDRPIVTFLREVDGDRPVTGKVYHRFFSLMEHVREMEALDDDRRDALLEIIEKRWNDAHSDMHAAGYALDPEFLTHAYTSSEEVGTLHFC